MALTDIKYRLKPQVGDTSPVDSLGVSGALTGGTIALVDRGGGNVAWQFSGANSSVAVPSKSVNAALSAKGGGLTVAIKFTITNFGSPEWTVFMGLFNAAVPQNATDSGGWLGFTRAGPGNIHIVSRGIYGATVSRPANVERTLVLRLSTNDGAGDQDSTYAWWDTTGRVGTTADDSGASYVDATWVYNTLTICCPTGSAIQVKDLAIWHEELTDAQCAAVADNMTAALLPPPKPTLTSPVGNATGPTTAVASVTTDTASGTLYCLTNTSPTATVAAIKSTGTSQAVTAAGVQNVPVIGLSASTVFYAHFVHTANSLDSTASDSSGFLTTSLPAAVLSSPAGTATGTTTATATVSTTVGSGTLYYMASANATETAATIKSSGASVAVSATGTQTVGFTSLTASTPYYTHFVQAANGQDSNVANGSGFTTASVSAAVLSSPAASAVTATTATASVNTNTASGTLYCLASANPTETAAAIKASGLTKTVTATGAQTFALTGLTQASTYYLHFLQTAAGVDSGVSNSSSFTTTAPVRTFTPTVKLEALADETPFANWPVHAVINDMAGNLVATKTGLVTNSLGLPPGFTVTAGSLNTDYRVTYVDDVDATIFAVENLRCT